MFLYTKGKVGHMPGKGNFTAVIDQFLSKLQVTLNPFCSIFLTFLRKDTLLPSTQFSKLQKR